MSSTIFLTGGTGFLGSYILRDLLLQGYTVRALRRRPVQLPWIDPVLLERVSWTEGDILDVVALEEAMQGADAVIHAAAVVSFAKADRKNMYAVNVDGTANVVNLALETGIKRFIYISSVAALGRMAGGDHVDEEKKWEESPLNTHYAISKFKAELQVWRGFAEGLEGVILNPSTILGLGDWNQGSCAIFKNVYEGFPWYTDGINGFVDVEDVARATLRALQSDIREQRYIINGDTWPFKRLQDTIAKEFGKKGPHRRSTPALLALAWRLEKIKSFLTGQRPLLTRESARVAVSRTWFENAKFLRDFPDFSYTPLATTIARACAGYTSRLKSS